MGYRQTWAVVFGKFLTVGDVIIKNPIREYVHNHDVAKLSALKSGISGNGFEN